MGKTLLVAGITTVLFACSNNTSSTNAKDDTSAHAGHNNPSGNVQNEDHMNAMHEAMNQMMQQMQSMKPTGDADYDFAMMMKLHHQSAVDMAKEVVEGSTDAAVKQHAQRTVNEQQNEISIFDEFLKSHKPSGTSQYGANTMQMMSSMQHGEMDMSSLEKMYASMMIPHHQEGVKMAEEYLKVAKDDQLRKIAKSITQTQPKEIEDYKQWLSK
jgi:uncharacterized protein (DUF305 family)